MALSRSELARADEASRPRPHGSRLRSRPGKPSTSSITCALDPKCFISMDKSFAGAFPRIMLQNVLASLVRDPVREGPVGSNPQHGLCDLVHRSGLHQQEMHSVG